MSDPMALLVQQSAHERGDLLVWTICASPADYPGKFTARPHSSRSNLPMQFVLTADSLDDLRAMLPPGLAHMTRDHEDHPVIVESWL
jgi:hypothetical protein